VEIQSRVPLTKRAVNDLIDELLKFNGGKMYIWFFICVLAVIAATLLHFLSVEHLKLQERYGKEKGTKIGEIYGFISGWSFFFFWMGIWVSPQPRFSVQILQNLSVLVPVVNFFIPLFHLIISIPFLLEGAWFGINGVKEITLKVAETHRADKIVTIGVYSIVRHPQHLGALLAHVGISFLLSAWYSLLFTPLMVVLIYLISRKEEEELIREFGREYEDYKKKVPMLIPRLRR
jgi:protein-S-isoprenylcysteine O-methyltransferase Ste14